MERSVVVCKWQLLNRFFIICKDIQWNNLFISNNYYCLCNSSGIMAKISVNNLLLDVDGLYLKQIRGQNSHFKWNRLKALKTYFPNCLLTNDWTVLVILHERFLFVFFYMSVYLLSFYNDYLKVLIYPLLSHSCIYTHQQYEVTLNWWYNIPCLGWFYSCIFSLL